MKIILIFWALSSSLYISGCTSNAPEPLPAASDQPLDPRIAKFLTQVSSHKIPIAGRSEIFNHYYQTKNKSQTALLFVPGMGEAAIKYYNLIEDLKPLNATIYMWDHIGQGFSSHLVPQDTRKIYIDSFDTYRANLAVLLQSLRNNYKQVIVIGHSMGAHLVLRTVLKNPEVTDQLILSSPLIALNEMVVPFSTIDSFLSFFDPHGPLPLYSYFKEQASDLGYVSNSQEKLNTYKTTREKYPELLRTELTVGWLRAAIKSLAEMKAEDYSPLIQPVLILQAEKDYLVNNEAQNDFCKQLRHCRLLLLKDSLHEIFFEKEPIYTEAIKQTLDFVR